MTGDAKVGKLLLGCGQASPVLKGRSLYETHTAVDVETNGRTLVVPFYASFNSFNPYIGNHITISTSDSNATDLSCSTQQTASNTNTSTLSTLVLCDYSLDAENIQHRDLTRTCGVDTNNMTTILGAPGTPPELTESRSSKSSSYGSQFSTHNDLATEITNFEDIGLDDDDGGNLEDLKGQHNGRGQITLGGQRDARYSSRTALPDLTCHAKVRASDSGSRSTVVRPMKRGFTSPSTVTLSGHTARTRSSSPPKQMPRSNSTYSVSLVGSGMGCSPTSSAAPSRRGSWQPKRKTIKEIEEEYHDSDDELPDDVNLWNVPISPSHSADVSPRSSFISTSVPRPPMQPTLPIPLDHNQLTPHTLPRKVSSSLPPPRRRLTPRSSSINMSRSNPTSPQMPNYSRNSRAKSWTLAMADLSPEARIVSQNLESHAEVFRETGNKPDTRPSGPNHRISAPSTIQLPPIQRGPLDFMPISKEKEAVLSRTRPSWLPPKDPKEEQRHLKEYQKMMAASIEAEKKKENRVKSVQSEIDTTRESLNRIWDYYIKPSTDIAAIDRRVNDLCWRGIPARIRGKVWQRAIGNPLALTEKTYNKALGRATSIKAKNAHELSPLDKSISAWFADIDRDAETAFPELGFFQRDGPMWQDLVNVCEAYACYRSDIGYFYGLQLVGALILLQLPDPGEAFIFMANCLNKPVTLAFHTGDVASMQRTYNRVISNLGVKFPRVHDYLFESMERGGLGLTGQEVFEPMFRTMFSNGLDFDRLCRVWDIWIFEGDRTLIKTAVAVLGNLQSQIFEVQGDSYLKRRNVQEMLGWGPFNRTDKGSYWKLDKLGKAEAFVDEIEAVGKLDYTGH